MLLLGLCHELHLSYFFSFFALPHLAGVEAAAVLVAASKAVFVTCHA
jgi:hypothetical protein